MEIILKTGNEQTSVEKCATMHFGEHIVVADPCLVGTAYEAPAYGYTIAQGDYDLFCSPKGSWIIKAGSKKLGDDIKPGDRIGRAIVDSGLCGFFDTSKSPKYAKKWKLFCDEFGNAAWATTDDGFISLAGGDGDKYVYELIDNNTKERIGLYVKFTPYD